MARTTDRVEFDSAVYTAEILPHEETSGWQIGNIDPGILTHEQLERLSAMVTASLTPVDTSELAYSDCTDGRWRMQLANGLFVPVRERTVGADAIEAFVMAESLGSRFYGGTKATIGERIYEVFSFLDDNGIKPSTHVNCGAAGGFVPVSENVVRFGNSDNNGNFINRQKKFVPVFDAGLFGRVVNDFGVRIAARAYENYSDALITDAVRKYSGDSAIAEYKDDGRGQHGHRELAIVRIADSGVSIDTNKLADMDASQPQVFVNNDARIERLASLFGRGHDEDYATAYMAAEAFSNAGWGTLGRNLQTIIIRRK